MVEINRDKPLKGDRITGIGSALVDLLIHEDDLFLTALGKEKGGMTLVENRDIDLILEKNPGDSHGGAWRSRLQHHCGGGTAGR